MNRLKASDLPAPHESVEQQCLFRWADMETGKYPELKWLYHVPNGGIKGGSGYREFETKEESIYCIYDFLDRLYFQKSLTTVEAIGRKYCETDGWAGQINQIMRDLIKKAEEEDV